MLQQDNEIARGQQRLIKRRMYDLCIDQGNQILPINGQESWSQVERDMKIVMRIPIWQEPGEINSKRTYCCPLLHCQLWNEDPSMGGTSTIDWSVILLSLLVAASTDPLLAKAATLDFRFRT